jgi:hypothetical protein
MCRARSTALIYGSGTYRQQLFDGPVVGGFATGNLIWDQLTNDTSGTTVMRAPADVEGGQRSLSAEDIHTARRGGSWTA